MTDVIITRRVHLPDPGRVARALRAPELGPRLVFFSGGSALKRLSRKLKLYTHNSIHLITPFDSGGSSAKLREAFGILSIGDLRNRLMALADETQAGNPEIYRLFSHRFPKDSANADLRARLDAMVRGEHPFVAEVARPLRRLVQTSLRMFAERMPADFDLRGASIGNLILSGGLLNNEGDIASVIFLFSQLVEVRGIVRPVSDADRHLRARLEDGTVLVGQHRLTGKEEAPIASKVTELSLVAALDADPIEAPDASAPIHPDVSQLIGQADVIVFPMGSFYSSVMASILPAGVGRAVAAQGCPKVYVPNTGVDPEQLGMTLSETVRRLCECMRQDRRTGSLLHSTADSATADGTTAQGLIDYVLLDTDDASYALPLDVAATEALGVKVVRLPLVRRHRAVDSDSSSRIDGDLLSQMLVSLGG